MTVPSDTSRQLIVNRIKTPDGTILTSYSVHDCQWHVDKNGDTYMVDGGTSYSRRSANEIPATDLSVYEGDSHESIREAFEWGTRGIDGTEPLTYKPLKNLTASHIRAILETQEHVPNWMQDIFETELEYRSTEGICG